MSLLVLLIVLKFSMILVNIVEIIKYIIKNRKIEIKEKNILI
jgi:hypothetical protein